MIFRYMSIFGLFDFFEFLIEAQITGTQYISFQGFRIFSVNSNVLGKFLVSPIWKFMKTYIYSKVMYSLVISVMFECIISSNYSYS